jgi:hypothetical protein
MSPCEEARSSQFHGFTLDFRPNILLSARAQCSNMAGCTKCGLLARGSRFDVDDLLAKTSFTPDSVFKRGGRGLLRKPKLRYSGLNFTISQGDHLVSWHVEKAIRFMRRHSKDLHKLAAAPGVATLQFEFSCYRRTISIQCDRLSAEFLYLAGKHDIAVEWSIWPDRTQLATILGKDLPRRAPAGHRRLMAAEKARSVGRIAKARKGKKRSAKSA